MSGCFNPMADSAERAIQAQLALARDAGAQLRIGEEVVAVAPRGAGVRVVTRARPRRRLRHRRRRAMGEVASPPAGADP
jgi:hypothetical protein